MKCEDCKYWDYDLYNTHVGGDNTETEFYEGFCRRYPPIRSNNPIDKECIEDKLPISFNSDWCGEYKKK